MMKKEYIFLMLTYFITLITGLTTVTKKIIYLGNAVEFRKKLKCVFSKIEEDLL